MKLLTRFTAYFKKLHIKNKRRFFIITALTICIMLSGWSVPIGSLIEFAFPAAIDIDMLDGFGTIVAAEDLQTRLHDSNIAEEIVSGVQSNLSGNVYDLIELPDMQDEPIGVKIVKIILDRLFS